MNLRKGEMQKKARGIQAEGLERRMLLTAVAFYDDSSYVNTASGSDSTDLLQQLQANSTYNVKTFNGTSAAAFSSGLSGANVLVIPALDNDDLAANLSSAAITVIDQFVSNGGGLIITGDSSGHFVSFLNDTFGYSESTASPGTPYPLSNHGTGTVFTAGPSDLQGNNNATAMPISKLPAGSDPIYNGINGVNTTVVLLPYGGQNSICFMGWDWTNGGLLGSQNGGWDSVLQLAVAQVTGQAAPTTTSVVVNSTSDTATGSGVVTLRDAVAIANSSIAPTTITFDPTVFAAAQTITLGGSQLELSNTAEPTTITGPAAGVTISGNGASRVLQIDQDVTATLSGVSVTDGSTGGPGGGIDDLGTLTFTNGSITDNSAADGGGGIQNCANLTMTDATISSNVAGGHGGGFENYGYSGDAIATLTDVTISDNDSERDGGGGIASEVNGGSGSTTLVLNNVTINGNQTSSNGGGIILDSSNTGTTVTNSTIENNTAAGDGGGIANFGADISITAVTLSGNTTTGGSGRGGGLYIGGTTALTDSTLNGNTSSFYGGGIDIESVTLTMVNDTVCDNTADGAGGINDGAGATAILADDTITGNTTAGGVFNAAECGGGITLDVSATISIANSIIATNSNTANAQQPDITGSINSQGNNLIGATNGSSGWISSDLTGTAAAPLNADLGPLANNGGSTETLLPLTGSPALGGGSVTLIPAGITTDQRGLSRTYNGTVDIGAVEGEAPPYSLVFATQPTAGTTDVLGTVAVDVEYGGAVVTSGQSNVTLTLAGGTAGATLGGSTTVATVNGVATFSNLSINTPGNAYTLTATDGSDTSAISQNFSVYSPPESIGNLQLSFGNQGLASHNVGFTSTDGVAQDGTQSVIIGTIGAAPSESFGITRYNSDGSLDTSLGTAGVTSTSFNGTDDVPAAVDVLAGGVILVAGTATTYADGIVSGSEFAVAEYNANGSLDTGFGGGTGETLVSFSTTAGTLSDDVLTSLAVGPGGVIYLGGSSGSDFAIAALSSTGTLNTGFGTGGKVLQSFGSGDDAINSLAVQTNGDIVAAGSAEIGSTTEIALARFLPSGGLDTHFGTKGLVTINVRGVYDSASSVVIEPKGDNILIGGLSATGSGVSLSSDFVLVQYTSAGKIDKTFGGGSVITSFGQPSAITQIALEADGDIIASGKTTASLADVTPDDLEVAVARYTTRGVLDNTFDGTGKTIVDLGSGVVDPADSHTVSMSELTIEPLDTGLGSEFDAFTSSEQGAVSMTTGGAILDAGNSGATTVEAELITAGVDLATSLLGSLPASVVGGAKATVSVVLAEDGTELATGTVTIDLQAAADALGDGETTITAVTEKISLKQKQSHSYKVAFVYPQTISKGSYYLVAVVISGSSLADLDAQSGVGASSHSINIAPAFISLQGSGLSAGSTFTDGKAAVAIFTVNNGGNVAAKGSTTADLILSTDQTAVDGISVDSAKLSVSLQPDKSKLYRVSFLLPKTFAAGTYYLIAVIDPVDSLGTTDHTDSTIFDATQVVVG